MSGGWDSWSEVVWGRWELSPTETLALAASLARHLGIAEGRGLYFERLDSADVLVTGLRQGEGAPSSSVCVAEGGFGNATSMRREGGRLIGEILGWCAPEVRALAQAEAYLSGPAIGDKERWNVLIGAVTRFWGIMVASFLRRVEMSRSDLPSFRDWAEAIGPLNPDVGEASEVVGDRPPRRGFFAPVEMRPVGSPSLGLGAVTTAVGARDLEWVLVVSHDGRLHRLVPEGPVHAISSGAYGPVSHLALHPAGRLAVLDSRSALMLWDLVSSRSIPLARSTGRRVVALGWDDQGEQFAALTVDGRLTIWSAAGGEPLSSCRLPGGAYSCLSWHADRSVYCGGTSLIRIDARREVSAMRMDLMPPVSALCAAGDSLAVGFLDGTIQVWVDGRIRLRRTNASHNGPIRSICNGTDGTMVSGGADGVIRFWEMPDGRLQRSLHLGETVDSAGFILGGSILYASSYLGVRFWASGK